MRHTAVAVLLLVALGAWRCSGEADPRTSTTPAPAAASHGVDVAGMDRAVAPGDDFFAYANGAWVRATEIPADRGQAGVWQVLTDKTQERTRQLLDELSRSQATQGSNPSTSLGTSPSTSLGASERKAADYYASYMDEAAIEAKGTAPLQPLLAPIAAIRDRTALARTICGELRTDVDALNNTDFYTDRLFGLWVSAGLGDPTRYSLYMLQGGLGMPDRDYYVDASPEMEKTRASYRAHIEAMLKLAGIADAAAKAPRIYALEEKIARAHQTRTESVDVGKANNPWPRDEFTRRAPGLDWPACFDAAGLANVPTIIVWHPSAVTGTSKLVASEPLETWKDYLTYYTIDHYAAVLPKAFVDEQFAFHGTVLSGTPQLRPRWKRAIDMTNHALGEAVGQLYVRRYFPPESKARAQAMVKNIVAAFDRRIDALDWMNPKTKASAKAKLTTLNVGIGYPDRWRDFAGLEVVRGEPLMNLWRAEKFEFEQNRAKVGQPADRAEWAMLPQVVNALNLPILNAMNFPAAILEPPFFDAAAPDVVNYGAIGSVIGHEVSHSFDDQGAQFDASGHFTNWWTPEDYEHFKSASKRLVEQYNAYEPFPGIHVNGQLTLSENLADLAGVSAAYDAYRTSSPNAPNANGFTPDQQFFLSFAQVWRSKTREPLARQLILTDGHAPDEARTATVRNLDAWYESFAVKPGQRLYLDPANRVRVW